MATSLCFTFSTYNVVTILPLASCHSSSRLRPRTNCRYLTDRDNFATASYPAEFAERLKANNILYDRDEHGEFSSSAVLPTVKVCSSRLSKGAAIGDRV
ncbi:hypothetical protein IE4872_PD02168 (plasmid) [Rhizobium gallicum]|uniref:Uncharacterized protein n=1 Tax=Rhizobium gallicum TaxID=56730 RepID=A0A1L5NXQ9_9HYPH|nr:hypothetical protein IE4872_PD02168 [Rhizobium gallicum]